MWHLRTTLKYHYHICRVIALLFVISSHNTNAGRELSGKWCHRCQRLRSRSPRSNWLDAWCVHHASPRLKLRGRSRDNASILFVSYDSNLLLLPSFSWILCLLSLYSSLPTSRSRNLSQDTFKVRLLDVCCMLWWVWLVLSCISTTSRAPARQKWVYRI